MKKRLTQQTVSQVQPAIGQGREDDRELPGHPRRLDPLVGGILGQAQLVDAIGEHRGVGGRQVEPPGVHLGEVGEQCGGCGALPGDERR